MTSRSMFRRVWLPMVGCLFVSASALAQDEAPADENSPTIPGRVSEVTLYRGQAMVTRTLSLKGEPGLSELIVPGLPSQILDNSLFAEGENIEVRAVRYRTRAVGTETRQAVRELDDALAELKVQLEAVAKRQQLHTEQDAYLKQLENFVGQVGQQDLQDAELDPEALQKLTVFLFEQKQNLVTARLENEVAQRQLTEQIELTQRKRAELAQGSSRTIREAVLFVNKEVPEPVTVRLSYLVANAGWSPAYNVRASSDAETMKLDYHALISQMTGEDWKDVRLTLSTATPALSSATPGLAPFKVSLSAAPAPTAGPPQPQSKDAFKQEYLTLNNQLQMAQQQQNNTLSLDTNFDNNWRMNSAINGIQILELRNTADRVEMLRAIESQVTEAPSIVYELETTVSLASRSDQQMVRIMERDLPADYYHVATPLLSPYVFREAELKNVSPNDLLGGPVTVYLDGRFVGKSELPTVARGENFVIGMGADSQLRTRRLLVEKTEEVQGGNREIGFEYRLFLENYKDREVTIRLYDRLPLVEGRADIEIDLEDEGQPLSTDELYVKSERPNGILRWDLTVPAETSNGDALSIDYKYTLEFDRQFRLTVQGDANTQRQEFQQLERSRGKL